MATLTAVPVIRERRLGPADGGEQSPSILVWFEDTREGRAALARAADIACSRQVRLTVLTVATHERVIGCGRCLQGTVLWNIEMEKMAREDLARARRLLEDPADVAYECGVGDPAEVISGVAARLHAPTVVLPRQRNRRLDPPSRRNVDRKVADSGPWEVL